MINDLLREIYETTSSKLDRIFLGSPSKIKKSNLSKIETKIEITLTAKTKNTQS